MKQSKQTSKKLYLRRRIFYSMINEFIASKSCTCGLWIKTVVLMFLTRNTFLTNPLSGRVSIHPGETRVNRTQMGYVKGMIIQLGFS